MTSAVPDPKQIKRDTSPKTSGDKRVLTVKQLPGRICLVEHTKGYR